MLDIPILALILYTNVEVIIMLQAPFDNKLLLKEFSLFLVKNTFNLIECPKYFFQLMSLVNIIFLIVPTSIMVCMTP